MNPPSKILIVDDTRSNRMILQQLLNGYEFQTDMAENGRDAMQSIKSEQYDLILMDLQMPEMSGLEATRRIREWESSHNLPAIPILALTAQDAPEDRTRTHEAGFDEHISKSTQHDRLINIIQSYLSQE